MAKKKFLEDVKLNPSRFYRLPSDVNRDRRLCDEERLEIFDAWEREVRADATEEPMTGEPNQLDQVIQARSDLKNRIPAFGDAVKYGGGTAENGGRS